MYIILQVVILKIFIKKNLEINKNIYTKTLKFQLIFSKNFTKVQWRGRTLGSQTWKLNTWEKLEVLAQCQHK
jgi:hypothetical protein